MAQTTQAVATQPIPTRDDRLLAGLAHLAFLGGFWLIAPIAIYVLRRKDSRFVAFHALQAIFLALATIPLTIATWIALMAATLGGALAFGERASGVFAVGWMFAIFLPALGVAAVSLIAGLRALKGENWSIPVLGRIAHNALDAPRE